MKKHIFTLIAMFWLSNLVSQNWVNVVDSTPSNFHYFYTSVVDTTTNTLYLGGFFEQINNLHTKAIIKYDGLKFDTLGAGLNAGVFQPSVVKNVIMFQNKLYVAGIFEKAGKYNLKNFARWNGTDWDSIDFHMNGYITSMMVYNNELYVSGDFDSIAGIKTDHVAKYDGANWYNVGQSSAGAIALANYKGIIYKSSTSNLEYFDGVNWQPWCSISGNIFSRISGMKTIDTMLYVYGKFDTIAGISCRGLAAWDGTIWHSFGFGTASSNMGGRIEDVIELNGELYAGGSASDSIDNVPNTGINLAKFDGNKWCTFLEPVDGLIRFLIGYNTELYVGGDFHQVGTTPAIPFIKWTGGNSTLACGQPVGINDLGFTNHTIIYPNPTSSFLNISDEQNELQNSIIEITNTLGEIVFQCQFKNQIDISFLQVGIYYLAVQDNLSRRVVKIIKH